MRLIIVNLGPELALMLCGKHEVIKVVNRTKVLGLHSYVGLGLGIL